MESQQLNDYKRQTVIKQGSSQDFVESKSMPLLSEHTDPFLLLLSFFIR